MTRLQKKCGIGLIILLLTLGLLTYLSRQIFLTLLPKVTVQDAFSGDISARQDVSARLHYGTQVQVISPADCYVVNSFVQPGEEVIEGQPLLQLSTQRLEESRLNLLRLQEADAAGIDLLSSYERQLLELQIQQRQELLENVEQLLSNDGLIAADRSCLIRKVAEKNTLITAGNVLLETTDQQEGSYLAWQLPADKAVPLFSTVTVELPVISSVDGQERVTNTEIAVKAARRWYDSQQNLYFYQSEPFLNMVAWEDGRQLRICVESSPRSFSTVIPISSINFENESTGTVFLLFSAEESGLGYDTVRSFTVKIQSKTETYAALESPIVGPVVTFTDKPLYDGAQVLVQH